MSLLANRPFDEPLSDGEEYSDERLRTLNRAIHGNTFRKPNSRVNKTALWYEPELESEEESGGKRIAPVQRRSRKRTDPSWTEFRKQVSTMARPLRLYKST
jgi:hypothetical protein